MNDSIAYSLEGLEALVCSFQDKTLPIVEWTHRAHLATTAWYLYRYSVDETICWLRSGIISYNLACGGKNTPEGGYHETLTLFWIGAVRHFLDRAGTQRPLPELVGELLHSELKHSGFPMRYYSRERLFSLPARARWIGPDLRELEWNEN